MDPADTRKVKRRDAAPVCGRLVQNKPYGTVDICGKPQGHDGTHYGKWRQTEWEDNPRGRQREPRIKSRNPVHNIPAGGNIRGNS